MPKVTGPDGIEREISTEEFMEALAGADPQNISIQQIVTDTSTGEEVERYDIPVGPDGSFDLFGGGLFGSLFADNRDLEEKIEDAEDGDEDTIDELAMLYLNGDESEGIAQDADKAFYWTQKLAEAENSNGMFNLGMFYAKGFGVERDFSKAAYWMEQAEEYGDTDAPHLVEEFRKAAEIQEKAAAGDAQAQAELAEFLTQFAGSLAQAGTEKDLAEAFDLAQKSAQQGNGHGLYALALAYEHGRGVEQDVDKALECYRKGTELGYAPCMHNYGCYFMRGDVVPTDKNRAIELCRKAAEQGYYLSEFFMAKCYETGDSVEEDLEQAWAWGEKAAEHGTAEIQYQVAKLYTYTGEDGKMINPDRARYWYGKAAEGGHRMAWQVLHFAPMWEEEEIEEEDEEDESDMDPEILAAMQLVNFALSNGMKPGASGTSQDITPMVNFVRELAEGGNEEAREVLDSFLAVAGEETGDTDSDEEAEESETPITEEELEEEAQQYLKTMESRFRSYKGEWAALGREIYDRLYAILTKNVKTEKDIERNRPKAEKYLETVKDEIKPKAERFHECIGELDEKLTYFHSHSLKNPHMLRLVKHFFQWVDFANPLVLQVGESTSEVSLPETYLNKKKQWMAEVPDDGSDDPVLEIRNKRQAEFEKIRKSLEARCEREAEEAKKTCEAVQKKLRKQAEQKEADLDAAKARLNSLGFFQFADKKAAKAQIKDLEDAIRQLRYEADQLQRDFKQQEKNRKEKVKEQLESERQKIKDRISARGMSLFDIVRADMDPGVRYTVSMLLELPGLPKELTNTTLHNRILTPLVSQGKLCRIYENGICYFMLP